MPTKRIVILANSVKKNEHCIAGKKNCLSRTVTLSMANGYGP